MNPPPAAASAEEEALPTLTQEETFAKISQYIPTVPGNDSVERPLSLREMLIELNNNPGNETSVRRHNLLQPLGYMQSKEVLTVLRDPVFWTKVNQLYEQSFPNKDIDAKDQLKMDGYNEALLKLIANHHFEEVASSAGKGSTGNALKDIDARGLEHNAGVKISPQTIDDWKNLAKSITEISNVEITDRQQRPIQKEFKLVYTDSMPAGFSGYHIRTDGELLIIVLPGYLKDASAVERDEGIDHEANEAYETEQLENELTKKTGRTKDQFTDEERNEIDRVAHILASAKTSVKFGKDGLTPFHRRQIAGMTKERVERLIREYNEVRSYQMGQIQQYLPVIYQEYIAYQEKFYQALRQKLEGGQLAGEQVTGLQPTASPAALPLGGIDFDPSKLNLQIKRDGRGVPLPLPQQNWESIDIKGLYPVIINIVPITSQTLPLLGQLDVQHEDLLVKS